MFREVYSLCIVVDSNEYISELSMDAVTSPGNNLVLSFIKRVSMKMHCWLTVSDEATVLTSIGDVSPTLWI